MNKKYDDDSLSSSFREVGPYLGIGMQLAFTVVLFVLVGSWIDKEYGYHYVFTITLSIIGVGVSIYNLIRTLSYLEKRKKENKD